MLLLSLCKHGKSLNFQCPLCFSDIMPVKVSENPYSLAYTSNHLALHTDTGWSLHPVGVGINQISSLNFILVSRSITINLSIWTFAPDFTYKVHTLHCIVQAKSIGGENEFVDTFNVASQMKQERPEEYELLCQTPLYHMDRGKDKFGTFYKQAVHPLFRYLDILDFF